MEEVTNRQPKQPTKEKYVTKTIGIREVGHEAVRNGQYAPVLFFQKHKRNNRKSS